jgi:hypothetical protein
MRNRSTFILLLLALPLAATAAAPDTRYREPAYGRLSYTLGEARVVARDPDGSGNADGVSVGGSARLTPDLFLAGSVTSVGSGSYDEDTVELGLGWRYAFTSQVDLVGIASLLHDDVQVNGRDRDGDFGPGLTGGLRTMLTPDIELGGYAKYTRLYNDSDLGLRAEGLYHFTPNFSALASAGLSNNERTASLGARWYFRPGN